MISRIFNQFLWPMGSSYFTDGGRFREFRTPSIQRGESTGSWSSKEEKQSRHNSLQWRGLQHRLAVKDYPFRESALCLRSNHKVVRNKFRRGKSKQTRKVLEKYPQKLKSNRRISSHWLIFQEYRMLRKPDARELERFSIRCHW